MAIMRGRAKQRKMAARFRRRRVSIIWFPHVTSAAPTLAELEGGVDMSRHFATYGRVAKIGGVTYAHLR